MLKRIRDFIYDINDIFVALIIVLAAAGIIIWRSTNIMDYPKYMAARSSNMTNTADVVINDDTQKNVVTPGSDTNTADPGTNTADPGTNTADPGTNTADPGTNTADPGTNTVDPGTETGDVVTASITIEKGFKGGWNRVAEMLISEGLLTADDKQPFVDKVNELNLATRLQIGTFELTSDMDYEQMIKVLCRVKD